MSSIGEKRNGIHKSYYASGKLSAEATYKDDVLNGLCKYYYESGELYEVKNYTNGFLDGEELSYYKNGNLSVRKNYKNGVEDGKIECWYMDGQKSGEYNCDMGRNTGEEKSWDTKGVLWYHYDGIKIVVSLDDNKRNCALPDGEFECWKVCKTEGDKNVYVKLIVPAEARRLTTIAFDKRGRVNSAYVSQIVDKDGNEYDVAYSFVREKSKGFMYKVGEKVKSDKYNGDYLNECSHGISVFLHKDMCDQYFKKD